MSNDIRNNPAVFMSSPVSGPAAHLVPPTTLEKIKTLFWLALDPSSDTGQWARAKLIEEYSALQDRVAALEKRLAQFPGEVTEEMVERAAKAIWENPKNYGDERTPWDQVPELIARDAFKDAEGKPYDPRDGFRSDARAALNAGLEKP